MTHRRLPPLQVLTKHLSRFYHRELPAQFRRRLPAPSAFVVERVVRKWMTSIKDRRASTVAISEHTSSAGVAPLETANLEPAQPEPEPLPSNRSVMFIRTCL
jgi:hypothetical protein